MGRGPLSVYRNFSSSVAALVTVLVLLVVDVLVGVFLALMHVGVLVFILGMTTHVNHLFSV
jgi:hypothetical protein